MHTSVLLDEAIESLNILEDGIYVDATLGYAGHSSKILQKLKKGFLFAYDQDDDAIAFSREKLKAIGPNFEIIRSNFKDLKKTLEARGTFEVNGILFDLGVNSVQLDQAERGFSYHQDAKLDMRMDTKQDFSAYNVVNEYTKEQLADILFRYGEEKYAKQIAKNIVKRRKEKPIETTLQLVEVIKEVMPYKAMKDKHPARKTFQAIRIEVNHELDVLEEVLDEALSLLKPGGRLCIITFHSLEDRIVKTKFRKFCEISPLVKGLPSIPAGYIPLAKPITRKAISPSKEELENNNRSRSAKLRVIERI